MNEYPEPLRAAVKRGSKVLDAAQPDWRTRIDLDALDVRICGMCVLGQLFDGYYSGVEVLTRHMFTTVEWVSEHGFYSDDPDDYPILTSLWTTVVKGDA
jgi:hypothetical protein